MLSGLLITYQCVIQDYTVEACVRSMLDIVDTVYINDGKSTDGTLDLLYSLEGEYGKDRVVIIEKNWVHDREFWARERNYILDNYIKEGWVLSLDADEVLHENELDNIRKAIDVSKIKSLSFDVIHFYGDPNHVISGPAWFVRHTQLWHKNTGIRWVHRPGGCADDILWPNGEPAHIIKHEPTHAILYHYGHCRSPKAMGMKVYRADDLYRNSKEYVSGKLADLHSWRYDMSRGGINEFTGTHPKYVKDWVEDHVNQKLEFIVE